MPGFAEFSIPGLSDGVAALEGQQRVVVSDVAGLLGGLVTNLTPLVVIGFALVPISYCVLWRTRFGLRLRSCGENPVAAESLGVDVYRYKYIGVVVSGALAGLGGRRARAQPRAVGLPRGADRRPRLHRARGDDLRQLAARRAARRRGAVRLRRRAAAAGRRPGRARAALHRHAARRDRGALVGRPAALGAGRRRARRRGRGLRDLLRDRHRPARVRGVRASARDAGGARRGVATPATTRRRRARSTGGGEGD